MKSFEERIFATREQELLLQAALLKGFDAIKAWQEWKSIVNVEGHHDNGSFRLLPLLYRNLRQHGIDDPFMNKLKGIYRKAWYENQTLLYDAGKVIRYLHDSGIKTMLLKGVPLTVLHYKNYGIRPMTDIDVLIPSSQASLAMDLLYRAGWKPMRPFKDGDLIYYHGRPFKDPSGRELDLHWHPFHNCHDSKDFWDAAVPLDMANISTLSPNSTDLLFHVVIHGVEWNEEPPIRWIADAVTLINSSDTEINWSRLINQAKRHRECLRVREGLNYLHARFQARIPKYIIDITNRFKVSYLEHVEYHYKLSSPKIRETRYNTHITLHMLYIYKYLRLNNGSRFIPTVLGLPNYLLWLFNAKDYYHLSYMLFLKGMKGIKRIIKIFFSRIMNKNLG